MTCLCGFTYEALLVLPQVVSPTGVCQAFKRGSRTEQCGELVTEHPREQPTTGDSSEVYVKFGKHWEETVLVVNSLKVAEILAEAKNHYHVMGDAVLLREVRTSIFAECHGEFVRNESLLSLEPKFFNSRFSFQTLNMTKSLRLLTKRVAKETGKICGLAKRVSSILVEVQVRAVDSDVIERFLTSMKTKKDLHIVGDVHRWCDFGVLNGRFVVEQSEIAREDKEESFDREEDVQSEEAYDFYTINEALSLSQNYR